MSRILALDVGEKRIGVAVSDPLNITAQAVKVIQRKNFEDTLQQIESLIKEYDVLKIIVGMPLCMDGTKKSQAKLVEEFASSITQNLSIPIELVDERLTTSQAERLLLEADISRKKRRLYIDKMASQLILQSYLDLHVQRNRPK